MLIGTEERFRAAVLVSGGFAPSSSAAAVSVGFVKRTKLPTLMLNGRYDYTFPLETHQIPLYEMLGAAPEDKRHVLYETGHMPLPHLEVIRESLDWYDKYLGPVTAAGE